jgi:hypothetical protein
MEQPDPFREEAYAACPFALVGILKWKEPNLAHGQVGSVIGRFFRNFFWVGAPP